MAKSNFSPADYEAIRAVVERVLPELDFRNPDHALAGDELLALLNRWGARLEYKKKKGVKFMSAASDLIERLEAETGQRVDDNDGDNLAMTGLFGAMSRMLGQSPPSYRERDDVAAGLLIRHRMTPEYRREQEGKRMRADLLMAGMSPEETQALME